MCQDGFAIGESCTLASAHRGARGDRFDPSKALV